MKIERATTSKGGPKDEEKPNVMPPPPDDERINCNRCNEEVHPLHIDLHLQHFCKKKNAASDVGSEAEEDAVDKPRKNIPKLVIAQHKDTDRTFAEEKPFEERRQKLRKMAAEAMERNKIEQEEPSDDDAATDMDVDVKREKKQDFYHRWVSSITAPVLFLPKGAPHDQPQEIFLFTFFPRYVHSYFLRSGSSGGQDKTPLISVCEGARTILPYLFSEDFHPHSILRHHIDQKNMEPVQDPTPQELEAAMASKRPGQIWDPTKSCMMKEHLKNVKVYPIRLGYYKADLPESMGSRIDRHVDGMTFSTSTDQKKETDQKKDEPVPAPPEVVQPDLEQVQLSLSANTQHLLAGYRDTTANLEDDQELNKTMSPEQRERFELRKRVRQVCELKEEAPEGHIMIHRGAFSTMLVMMDLCFQHIIDDMKIDICDPRKVKEFVITGHSRGGMQANILAYLFLLQYRDIFRLSRAVDQKRATMWADRPLPKSGKKSVKRLRYEEEKRRWPWGGMRYHVVTFAAGPVGNGIWPAVLLEKVCFFLKSPRQFPQQNDCYHGMRGTFSTIA